jgi:hypothetical protein
MSMRHIKTPLLFQGKNKHHEYFEGWYYKQGTKDGKTVVSLIPGISLDGGDSHCFVQTIHMSLDKNGGRDVNTSYYKYSLKDFSYSDDPFIIKIADNLFMESMVSVNLNARESKAEGTLLFDDLTPVKTSTSFPNIMGYFAYFPMMECYHGVISMNHKVHGSLNINGSNIEFYDGKGYLEKDWGTSFPKKYIWIQCNHFQNENVSLFFSAAHIPFLGQSFFGFICNLVIGDVEYRFATYNRSKLLIEDINESRAILRLVSKQAELKVEACLNHAGKLIAPRKGKMQDTIKEGLSGDVRIVLSHRDHRLIYEEWSSMAGIEISGF